MKTENEIFTATEFFDRLHDYKLFNPATFSIIGMVKKSDGKEKTIEFALGGTCSSWVTIPLDFIENVEVIRLVRCKDHEHPLVNLNLRAPESPEGKLLITLLEKTQQGIKDFKSPQVFSNEADIFLNSDAVMPTSTARMGPKFGGYRNNIESSLCMWTWVDEWVCKTNGNTTTCGWVGSWKCI